jgi:hypothetical protein
VVAGALFAPVAVLFLVRDSGSGPGEADEAELQVPMLLCFFGFPACVGALLGYWFARWVGSRHGSLPDAAGVQGSE